MRGRRKLKLAVLLSRVPVSLLGLVIAASSAQASCGGTDDDGLGPDFSHADARAPGLDGSGADAPPADAHPSSFDAPSEDSAEDRADGMLYGDGYGKEDAQEDSSCVTSTATYPPAPGCPAGNHTWACWPPTPATGGIPASNYTVLTLCGEVVVIDKNTKLMWGQDEESDTYTWVEAAAACKSSRRAGFSDWRIPTSNELISIADYGSSTALLNPNVFKGSYGALWTADVSAVQSGYALEMNAGGGIYPTPVANDDNVRCVR